ncbi:hypothetical protein [Hyphomicrobium facile]|uniref:Uncharacterized protein n=1 Tax=Hyphomicrobium facile TaxID=51670 RepID=A0A1I7N2B1_9HYPH|nr:hypothetical protein [Hyphomicrobium facile]SFV28755.1 hypothetical protein SAMN04488557_1084 [Hyphomicrobium facile]
MLHRFRWFVIAFSMVLALAPFAGIAAAALLALVARCEINDAAKNACFAFGADLQPWLSSLSTTAVLGNITLPAVAAVLMFWAVVESAGLLFRR